MAMFTGAVSAIFNPDALSLEYARKVARRDFEPIYSDPDAKYAATYEIDLDTLSPQVVMPGSAKSQNTRPVEELAGISLHRAYIGSCASGRIEEIRAAAEIVKGKKIAPSVQFIVVPTSAQIYAQAEAEGLLAILSEAGAQVARSSCDFCVGYASPLKAGERAISTGVLNIPGRMGSTEAEIYMASAYTVAASALAGHIVDPREVLA
jgi:3-isopropylmalate/(R)-2-methylmalate dehydratase large subunit